MVESFADIGGIRFNSRYKNVYKFCCNWYWPQYETVDYNINNYYANSKQRGIAHEEYLRLLWLFFLYKWIVFIIASVFPIGSHPFMIRGSVKDRLNQRTLQF